MADAGVFFEFLPMGSFDEARVGALGTKAVPISGVETGVDYALVITTPAGLARYVIGDVVRFNLDGAARLTYVGRTKLQLSAFGEHVIEKEITDALMRCAGATAGRSSTSTSPRCLRNRPRKDRGPPRMVGRAQAGNPHDPDRALMAVRARRSCGA
jgi:hypothetical protein